jgi:hypothetical protein
VAALIALVPALAGLYGLYIAWRSEQRQRGEQEKAASRWEEEARRWEKEREEEARRREKEREEEARRREREARERERKTIVHLINRLEPHQVLDAELAPPHGEYYGRPQPMVDAVKVIRDDLVNAKSELGENHKDIQLIQTMIESCNKFLKPLELLAGNKDMADGGPAFHCAIDDHHRTFRDAMWGNIRELEQRNDI